MLKIKLPVYSTKSSNVTENTALRRVKYMNTKSRNANNIFTLSNKIKHKYLRKNKSSMLICLLVLRKSLLLSYS